jgi:hypothetical protein
LAIVESYLNKLEEGATETVYQHILCGFYEKENPFDHCLIINNKDSTGGNGKPTGIPDLEKIAQARGLSPDPSVAQPTLGSLRQQIADGYPVIVLVDAQGHNPTHKMTQSKVQHWLVVVGIAPCPQGIGLLDTDECVYVDDPGRGSPSDGRYKAFEISSFDQVWGRNDPPSCDDRNRVQNPDGCHSNAHAALVLKPRVSISASYGSSSTGKILLPDAQAGRFYFAQFSASDGTPPYHWTIIPNPDQIPGAMISADSSTQFSIFGFPSPARTFQFGIQVKDADGFTAARDVVLNVLTAASVALRVTMGVDLPAGQVGISYPSFALSAAGGSSPYTWTLLSSPPLGLSVAKDGMVTGVPAQSGDYNLDVKLQDGSSPPVTVTTTFRISILRATPPLVISAVVPASSSLGPGESTVVNCHAAGGAQPLAYVWTATAGTISGSGPAITWSAPADVGFYTVTCKVTDSEGQVDSQPVTIGVSSRKGGLSVSVNPSTGVVNQTQFMITGAGATPGKSVIALSTRPDGTVKTFANTADGKGNFSFGPFTADLPGKYLEVYSDEVSKSSATITYMVTAGAGPVLSSISPTTAPASIFTMTLNGTAFQNGAGLKVHVTGPATDSTTPPVTFLSSTQIKAQLDMRGGPGSFQIQVINPDGQASNFLPFTITASAPVLSSISPTTAPASIFTMTLNGAGFQNGAGLKVHVTGPATDSTTPPVTFLSSTQIKAQLDMRGGPGSFQIQVINPDGQASNFLPFTITASAPGSVVVNPTSGNWTTSPQNVSVSSSGASTIWYTIRTTLDGSIPADPPDPTSTLNDGSITGSSGLFQVFASAGQFKHLKVKFRGQNGTGYGPTSAVFSYIIDLRAAPVLSSISPTTASASIFTMTLNGTGFQNGGGLKVHVTGPATDSTTPPVTFLSSTQITAQLDMRGGPGSFQIQVINPDGQASNFLPFTITASAPGSVVVNPTSGNWTTSPQNVSVSSSGASTIWFTIRSTLDGSIPADPPDPTSSLNDGSITGSSGIFQVFASAGQFKHLKVKFRGQNAAGYGPTSVVFSYTIDLRTASALNLTPDERANEGGLKNRFLR